MEEEKENRAREKESLSIALPSSPAEDAEEERRGGGVGRDAGKKASRFR
jgi:hypothetical protein